ncbi:Protoporphyrinogen oxidase [Mucilaginibacter sp. OK268]|uniref:protoporphyrinogen/coproporphyrinogen oxidase n=1 Tax=Mucilaginibacter sp. OK268 TaxID=1881048 RepID=UPI00087E352F|nr:FAD-dependent oxidoreductase [Mucilaginibacter sp. OK268]SDQ00102.1 Protoporphyrinogen oxidase [Mucilaginibacter sp. OK268]
MITILGAGLSGLSSSYHIGHNQCVIYEKNNHATGHVHSEYINGFTWDEGPHVSFTDNEYVKTLFKESVKGNVLEYPVKTINYYKGSWIPHPAQSNLYAVPQPLRDKCLEAFLSARAFYTDDFIPKNYQEWLEYSFGNTFADTFPAAYTRKYWTTEPQQLSTQWVGKRVFFPEIDQVKEGYLGPLKEETHYVKKVRYPATGGYMSFADKLLQGSNIKLNYELSHINFDTKQLSFQNGENVEYDKLINTIPLPVLIQKSNAPDYVKQAAEALNCSSVLLVNVVANHETARPENWIYVYDEDKYSTRINCTELLSPNNAPKGKTGIQVEVYFSNYNQKNISDEEIAEAVLKELLEMGLILDRNYIETYHTKWVQWANVIFDHQQVKNQDIVLGWLEQYGLTRENDDLMPMTNWAEGDNTKYGDLILAGRFGQWKYYWTDDCVLRGLRVSQGLKNTI